MNSIKSIAIMRAIRWAVLIFIAGLLVIGLSAQGDSVCEVAEDQDLISVVDEICFGVGENQVCYGNENVTVTPREETGTLDFDAPGDNANLVDVQSLSLSALTQEAGNPAITRWGIAKMRLLSVSPRGSEDITMLLFGDVSIDNEADVGNTVIVEVMAEEETNIRNTPRAVNSTVIASVSEGDIIEAIGRLDDTSWLRVRSPEGDAVGWLLGELVKPVSDEDSIDMLRVQDSQSNYYGPMQAFTYRSGTSCANQVSDGMFIQTPEGYARVTLLVNGVNIDLRGSANGATAFVEANQEAGMQVSMLDGVAYVGSNGQSYYVDTYQQTTIPMGSNMTATGSPSAPQPADIDRLQQSALLSTIRNPNLPWLPPTTEEPFWDDTTADDNTTDTAANTTDTTANTTDTTDTAANTTDTTDTAANTADGGSVDSGGSAPPAEGNGSDAGGSKFGCERGNSCNAPGRSGS